MKRITTSLALVSVLVASLAGVATAQSSDADASPDASVITVLVIFAEPVLAGYSATPGADSGVTATVEDDTVLRIVLPAGVEPGTDLPVTLTSGAVANVVRVSANDASFDELVAALDSVGVSPSDRWANEIMEYRPYDTADPTLAHLQDELAKYDPSPETLAGILSVLQP
jgi:hypothetical protein